MTRLIYSRSTAHADDNTYNVVTQMDFSGDIHPLRLRQALRDLIDVAPIFKSYFYEIENRIYVKADLDCPISIPLVDSNRKSIEERVQAFREEPIGVRRPPLWRAEIHCTDNGQTALLLCIHHLLFDGWSMNLLEEELGARYEAIADGRQYAKGRLNWFDYCHWALDLNKSKPYLDSICYWREKLKNINARIELPLTNHYKKPNSNVGKPVRFQSKTVQLLKQFADDRVSLYLRYFSLSI